MMRRTTLAAGTLIFAVLLSSIASWGSSNNSPISLIENFHAALLASMKSATKTSVKQRFDALEQIVDHTFHSKLMIQVASGSHWRKASETQQTLLVTGFSKFSAATYAAQFDGFSGQSFHTIGQKPGPKTDILVETRIINPGSGTISLIYVVRKKNDRWQVIDVLVDTGISNLARMRSEYRQVLKSGGITELINVLKDKTTVLLAN